MKVIHEYAKKNLRKLTRNEDANCETCAFAEKVKTIDGEDAMLCKAALYHLNTLACYVEKYE